MTLDAIEWWIRLIAAAMALALVGTALLGLWRGLQRPKGREVGLGRRVLNARVYFLVSVLYFGMWFLLWRPFAPTLPVPVQAVALIGGVLFYFSGLILYMWGWLTLGEMYNVSSSLGVQLYSDHHLVTSGPFAHVRHPMYLAFFLSAFGGVLIYRTWTLVFVLLTFFGLVIRARREEQALSAEFGEQWDAYCRRVPPWIPRCRR